VKPEFLGTPSEKNLVLHVYGGLFRILGINGCIWVAVISLVKAFGKEHFWAVEVGRSHW
jgi:hypothetical protein